MACAKCNTNLKRVVSITNTPYYYCSTCNYNKNKVLKNIAFDYLLKELCINLQNAKYASTKKIEILNLNNNLNLLINNVNIYNVDFPYSFSTMDIYFLENTLNDLVEDTMNIDSTLLDILVCA
ncbi:MAG: hypothetical protein ACRDA3_06615 [Peptostreptococcaceae bacterium]